MRAVNAFSKPIFWLKMQLDMLFQLRMATLRPKI